METKELYFVKFTALPQHMREEARQRALKNGYSETELMNLWFKHDGKRLLAGCIDKSFKF